MILTKIKTWIADQYDYINLDHVESVYIDSDHYDVHMSDDSVVCAALDDPTISGLITTANTNYTGT